MADAPDRSFPQVSRRLLSKPQDALEGVVLSVSGAASWPEAVWVGAGLGTQEGQTRQQSVP